MCTVKRALLFIFVIEFMVIAHGDNLLRTLMEKRAQKMDLDLTGIDFFDDNLNDIRRNLSDQNTNLKLPPFLDAAIDAFLDLSSTMKIGSED